MLRGSKKSKFVSRERLKMRLKTCMSLLITTGLVREIRVVEHLSEIETVMLSRNITLLLARASKMVA